MSELSEYGEQYYQRWAAEQQRQRRRDRAYSDPVDDRYAGNGQDPNAGVPANDDKPPDDDTGEPRHDEPTTWEPVDLGPYLRGDIEVPKPSLGFTRSDGLHVIYPGCEHVFFGETESGKSWLALGCVAAELVEGHHVVYVHYEEGPANTLERLKLLGVDDTTLVAQLHFVSPTKPTRQEGLTALLALTPTLVVHDGVNEAMALHGDEIIKDPAGASKFRRRLVVPFLDIGAASIACDHVPLAHDPGRRDAFGSVHKGNALNGARFLLENVAPFGRDMRGASHVFVTKDRPGRLRANGRPSGKTPGKTYLGTLVVDDSEPFEPLSVRFFAPRDDDERVGKQAVTPEELGDIVHGVIAALLDHTVESQRRLFAEMRKAGQTFRESAIRDAVDDLVVSGRLVEVPGKRGAYGYQAVSTAAQESST